MPSFYDSLGFKRSPFYREPLEPTDEDLQVFTGRTDDVKRFMASLNPDHGVHLVSGQRGVGKTSFVNIMQYLTSLDEPGSKLQRYGITFYPERMLPCYRKLQLDDQDTIDKVLMRAISSLIFSGDQFLKENSGHKFDLNAFNAAKSEFQEITMGSISRAEQFVDANSKFALLVRMVAALRSSLNRRGIFLCIDNLDIIDLQTSTRLLNELRDYLFIPGLCIVLLGPEGFYADLRSTEDGLRIIDRITGQETLLRSLSEDEVLSILDVRKRTFAIDGKNPPPLPLESEYVRELYRVTGGQIRLLFKICESITIQVLSQYPSLKSVKAVDAASHLKDVIIRETKLGSYTKRQIELLKNCLNSPMRPKQYKELKLDSGAHFVQLADRLIQDDLLTKRSEGSAVYYEPTGLLKLCRHVDII